MASSRLASSLRAYFVSLVLLLGFIVLAVLVASAHPPLLALNDYMMDLMLETRSDHVTTVLAIYTTIGNPPVLAALTAVVSLGLIAARRPIDGLFIGGATAVTAVVSELIKALISSPRPEVEYLTKLPTSHSFPSGHTISFLVFAGALLLVVSFALEGTRFGTLATRRMVFLIGSLSIVAMAYSRMYLGVHWLSDVAGSVLLGSAILSMAAVVWARAHAARRGIGA